MSQNPFVIPTLDDPLAPPAARTDGGPRGPYDEALAAGEELRSRPFEAAGAVQVMKQHVKDRMTVWERIDALQDKGEKPTILYQNWGKNLDGASLVTAILRTATTSRSAPARWTRRTAGSSRTSSAWRASAASRSSA